MPQQVDDIHRALMQDPDFKPEDPKQSKEEAAWAVAWSRYKQMQKNSAALSLAKDLSGAEDADSKIPPKQGPPSTLTGGSKRGEHVMQGGDSAKGTDQAPRTAIERMKPLVALKEWLAKNGALGERHDSQGMIIRRRSVPGVRRT